MTTSIYAWTLFAQISRWQRLGDGLHRGGRGRVDMADLVPWLIALVVIGIGVAIAVAIIKKNDFSKPCDDPGKLFRELSRAHKLDFQSQRLLRQLAVAHPFDQPAEIFLSPIAFEPHAVPEHLRSEQPRIDKLRARLF